MKGVLCIGGITHNAPGVTARWRQAAGGGAIRLIRGMTKEYGETRGTTARASVTPPLR